MYLFIGLSYRAAHENNDDAVVVECLCGKCALTIS